jgi:hypothetical protein
MYVLSIRVKGEKSSHTFPEISMGRTYPDPEKVASEVKKAQESFEKIHGTRPAYQTVESKLEDRNRVRTNGGIVVKG